MGETSSTAYRGDRGKTAYDHSQAAHAPSNAQANVIETVKVNGTALTPSSKSVNITVPTKVSALTNDSGYITSSGTAKTISDTLPISKGGTGKTTGVDAVNALINSLPVWTTNPVDDGYFISQDTGLSETYGRRKTSALWNYIKSKLATVATSGSYNDLSNKPTIPSVGNGTITITQNGTTKGTFTTNQSGNTTIALTDNNTTYGIATQSANGLESADDKKKLDGIATGAEVNQNAFSNVTVGSTTVSADSKTDTLTLVAGSNVTITPDATNDKITISSAHPSITKSTDSTSTASPSAGGTFTAVDSVTRDSNGHVTKVNTKTVTLPNTSVVVDSALSSTSTNPVQNKVVYSALSGKSDTRHTHTKSDVGLENVDNTRQMPLSNWNWSAGSGQPSWLWGGNEIANYYVYRPSDLEVKYANSAGNADTLDGNHASAFATASHSHSYLPLSGGTLTGDLKANSMVQAGDKISIYTDGEGGNIDIRSANNTYGYQIDADSDTALRCYCYTVNPWEYKSHWSLDHCGVLSVMGSSNPGFAIHNGMRIIGQNDSSYCTTHIYAANLSYPHLWLRQFTNAFQFFPNTTYVANTQQVHIGHSEYRFGDGYFTNLYNSSGVITTSDRNKKNSIKDIDGEFVQKIIEGLAPKSFKFNDGTSGRTHFGIIAQDLEELLESLGISNMDFAPLVKEYPDKEVEIENPDYDEYDENSQKYIKKLEKDYDGEPTYNVRYEEFIMLIVKYCQQLKEAITTIENRLSILETN